MKSEQTLCACIYNEMQREESKLFEAEKNSRRRNWLLLKALIFIVITPLRL